MSSYELLDVVIHRVAKVPTNAVEHHPNGQTLSCIRRTYPVTDDVEVSMNQRYYLVVRKSANTEMCVHL